MCSEMSNINSISARLFLINTFILSVSHISTFEMSDVNSISARLCLINTCILSVTFPPLKRLMSTASQPDRVWSTLAFCLSVTFPPLKSLTSAASQARLCLVNTCILSAACPALSKSHPICDSSALTRPLFCHIPINYFWLDLKF